MKRKTLLKNEYEIVKYIESISIDEVDEEMILELFRGAHAVLCFTSVDSLEFGSPEGNIKDTKKQKEYNLIPIQSAPAIVVENGKVLDGNHRLRAALKQGASHVWTYNIEYK